MKKYNVTVNGTLYEVVVEAADADSVSAPKVQNTPVVAPAAGGETVSAPMPGTILAVNVQNGARVQKGDVLVILEAMKMENEICAPCSGTVSSVVAKGTSVETGSVICIIA